MTEAVKDASLRMWVAEDMHMPVTWPMVLQVDNAAGESFQHSTCGASKLKGVFNLCDARIHVQELKDEGRVNAVHVDTTKNLADMLTKGLKAEVRNTLEKHLWEISMTAAGVWSGPFRGHVSRRAGRHVSKRPSLRTVA